DHGEADRPDEEQPPAADAVGQGSHRHEEAGEDERVDVHDPQELRAGGPQVCRDLRQGKAEDGVVHGHEQHRQHQCDESDPATVAERGCRGLRCRHRDGGHDVPLTTSGGQGDAARRSSVPSRRYSNAWPATLTTMPPAPAARAKVLHAFAELLVTSGERSATLDAVAERAGVSKGGLLYHFPTRDALVDGLVDHLHALIAADVAVMTSAPEGPVAYLLRSSLETGGELDLAFRGVSQLAQGSAPHARTAL